MTDETHAPSPEVTPQGAPAAEVPPPAPADSYQFPPVVVPAPANPATAARIVLCFRPQGWTRYQNYREARPGIVANAFGGASYNCNVNVFLDGGNDAETLAEFRNSPIGNTLMSVPIYDPLTDE